MYQPLSKQPTWMSRFGLLNRFCRKDTNGVNTLLSHGRIVVHAFSWKSDMESTVN